MSALAPHLFVCKQYAVDMAFWLLLHRCLGPFYAGFALAKMVSGEYLFMLLIIVTWLVIHFILMTINARDVAWVQQGEQMRLQALREQRDRQHREQWGPWDV